MVTEPNIRITNAALNARLPNSRRSTSGLSMRLCRYTNSTPTTRPIRMLVAGIVAQPSLASSLMPKMIGRTVASDSSTLGTSRRPAFGSRYSGSSTGPRTSSSTITGAPVRNTAPHQKCSRIAPPTTGPRAPPTIRQLNHTAMATPRCLASRNTLLIRASVDGISVAPAMPISARTAIRAGTVVA